MTLVVDASLAVASLIDTGIEGAWAYELLTSNELVAPHLMQVEATNILRRNELRGFVSRPQAEAAYRDLMRLPVVLFGLQRFTERVWELRENVTAYDACYVALAEDLDLPLATLDLTLTRSPGPRCKFLIPPSHS